MAFGSAGGYSNLPNGNFSPVIYSQKVIKTFRKNSVVEAITNTDYAGEIENFGDSVEIITEPDVTVKPYVRGQQLETESLDDANITMTVDQANYFQFAVDDIEKKHSHVNWAEMATNRAAYKLRDAYDTEVLQYMITQSATDYGTTGAPVDLGFETGEVSPLDALNRLTRILDTADVPEENRFFVADEYFWELMAKEDSKLMDHDYTSASENLLRMGNVYKGYIRGFQCFKSRNLTVSAGVYRTALAGHISSTATASQLTKVESFRSQVTFADVVRGMHLYGRKTVRPEGLASLYWLED